MGEVTDLGSEGACMAVDADLPLMLFSSFLLLLYVFLFPSFFGSVFWLVLFFQPDCKASFKGENFET